MGLQDEAGEQPRRPAHPLVMSSCRPLGDETGSALPAADAQQHDRHGAEHDANVLAE